MLYPVTFFALLLLCLTVEFFIVVIIRLSRNRFEGAAASAETSSYALQFLQFLRESPRCS